MDNFLNWVSNNVWIVSIITLVLGAYLNALFKGYNDIVIRLVEKKAECYSKYFDVLLVPKLDDRLYFYHKNLIILYGNDEVIEKLAICERNGINNTTEEGQKLYLELINAMKRDLEKPRVIKSWFKRRFMKDDLKSDIKDILLFEKTKIKK